MTSKNLLTCQFCPGSLFKTKGSLRYHQSKEHTKSVKITLVGLGQVTIIRNEDNMFVCPCGAFFPGRASVARHGKQCDGKQNQGDKLGLITSIGLNTANDQLSATAPRSFNHATLSACGALKETPDAQRKTLRVVDALELKPIALTGPDGFEYNLLGDSSVVSRLVAYQPAVTFNAAHSEKSKTVDDNIGCSSSDLSHLIQHGPYNNCISINDFSELDAKLCYHLNKDWRFKKSMMYFCSQVLAGAILMEGTTAILVNCLEVYGRTPSVDAHHERFLTGKSSRMTSHPPNDSLYPGVHATIQYEDNSRRLVIGTNAMNALVTSSIRIDNEIEPDVGSSTMQFKPTCKTRIFVSSKSAKYAMEFIEQKPPCELYPFDTCSQLRQLRSKFNNPTTYLLLRSSSSYTNRCYLRPYTIWTLADFDSTAALPSQSSMASKMFQLVIFAVINGTNALKKDEIETLYADCSDGVTKASLEAILNQFGSSDELMVLKNTNLNMVLKQMATSMMTDLQRINKKVAVSILDAFKSLCSHS
ncbi:hypothetical protein BDF19DRAFT_413340 [Syncephalis fuscata]|nr:hypothetical protein BDF19DRAFT_413340 [Syncephalis fuscata]